jgi:hypothetical protein
MDAKNAKTRTDRKHYAQQELMDGISKVLGYWQENLSREETEALGEDGIEEINELMRQQADRVAKLLGYEKAWVS